MSGSRRRNGKQAADKQADQGYLFDWNEVRDDLDVDLDADYHRPAANLGARGEVQGSPVAYTDYDPSGHVVASSESSTAAMSNTLKFGFGVRHRPAKPEPASKDPRAQQDSTSPLSAADFHDLGAISEHQDSLTVPTVTFKRFSKQKKASRFQISPGVRDALIGAGIVAAVGIAAAVSVATLGLAPAVLGGAAALVGGSILGLSAAATGGIVLGGASVIGVGLFAGIANRIGFGRRQVKALRKRNTDLQRDLYATQNKLRAANAVIKDELPAARNAMKSAIDAEQATLSKLEDEQQKYDAMVVAKDQQISVRDHRIADLSKTVDVLQDSLSAAAEKKFELEQAEKNRRVWGHASGESMRSSSSSDSDNDSRPPSPSEAKRGKATAGSAGQQVARRVVLATSKPSQQGGMFGRVRSFTRGAANRVVQSAYKQAAYYAPTVTRGK